MKLNKKIFTKIALGIILGGVAGLAASYLYGYFGSSCPLICNGKIAVTIGMIAGALFSVDSKDFKEAETES